ncbi:hypothetical protein [Glaciimonas soli]|uniref:Uncharacterized protein n=1 Tax=Glaciimonas soli TaxID=2590999 RepID=A0A843YNH0_9BURK|nr:hypothetical protein [Glaciimonas soli]MQQ99526.1 hypothetical protein [Glaciimonas soli]
MGAASGSAANSIYFPAPNRVSYIAVAVFLSLMLHGLLIFLFRDYRPDSQIESPETEQFAPLEVHIRLTPPQAALVVPKSAPAANIAPKNRRKNPAIAASKRSEANAATSNTRVNIAPSTPADTPAAEHIAGSPNSNKSLDVDQLRSSVGAIVNGIDKERDQTAVGQLRTKPLYAPEAETRLARDIAKSGRPDCFVANGMRGGLLAPLYLLAEKKGTGCRLF